MSNTHILTAYTLLGENYATFLKPFFWGGIETPSIILIQFKRMI